MSAVIACMVCARPFDSLLTSGLHAGVLVMAVVVVAILAAIARGALRLLREDAAATIGPGPDDGPEQTVSTNHEVAALAADHGVRP